jgi:hypothetical protein
MGFFAPLGRVGFTDAFWRSICRRAIMIHWRRNRPAVGYPPYVYLITCSAPLFSACFARRKRNRPAVGWLPYDHQTVLAFSSNLFGSITHRGGRDARVPIRAASRQLSATPTGDGLEYQHDSRIFGTRASLAPTTSTFFSFADAFSAPSVFVLLRSPKTLFTKKARRSVAHLTITNA